MTFCHTNFFLVSIVVIIEVRSWQKGTEERNECLRGICIITS